MSGRGRGFEQTSGLTAGSQRRDRLGFGFVTLHDERLDILPEERDEDREEDSAEEPSAEGPELLLVLEVEGDPLAVEVSLLDRARDRGGDLPESLGVHQG